LAAHFPALQAPLVVHAPPVHPVAHNSHFLVVASKILEEAQVSHSLAFEQVAQL